MEFICVDISFTRVESYQADLLIDAMAGIGFDTFNETATGIEAYIRAEDFSEDKLKDCIAELGEDMAFSYTVNNVVSENWNKEWEKNFSPMVVKDTCYVRATFHEPRPEFKYEIVIDPKMAFGTGHHQTTTMMMEYILEGDFKGKKVLDMGCGTGILAILAGKCGAGALTAIDYDPVCYDSVLENAALNDTRIIAACGGKEAIPEEQFDIILANINRNILLDQIPAYAGVLAGGGSIYFSGFYESPDLDMIRELCEQYAIRYAGHKKMGEWVAACFKKN